MANNTISTVDSKHTTYPQRLKDFTHARQMYLQKRDEVVAAGKRIDMNDWFISHAEPALREVEDEILRTDDPDEMRRFQKLRSHVTTQLNQLNMNASSLLGLHRQLYEECERREKMVREIGHDVGIYLTQLPKLKKY